MAEEFEYEEQTEQLPPLPKGYEPIKKSSSIPPLPQGYEPISQKKNPIGNVSIDGTKGIFPSKSQSQSTFQQGTDLASGAALGKIKPVPQSIGEGVQKDKNKDDSVLGGIYNTLVGSIGSVVGGIVEAESSRQRAMGIPSINIPARKITEDFINKARSSSSSLENEQARSKFDITDNLQLSDVKALLFQAPKMALDMAMGAATAGTSFFIQSVNDNAKELEANPNSAKLTPTEKAGYLFTQASVQAALEKFALDRVFKATGMGKVASDKIASEITQELIKKGTKATAKEIEELAMKKAASFASKVKRVGLKAATSGGVEGATEGVQSVGSDAIKILTNKATGKQVFDEEDITANMVKNFVNSTVQGAAFGGVMGGAASGLQNTNKAIRNEIAKTGDLDAVQQKIAEQIELGNITEEEAAAANITAQQYAEIASKIPAEIPEEQKYKIIGGIEQRENLKRSIEETQREIAEIDDAFPEYKKGKQDQIDLLNDKLNQTNDYINEIVTGKETKYKKESDGRKTSYYKIDTDGNEIPISREYYDIATSIKEENKLKEKQTEVSQKNVPEGNIEQPTLLEQDVIKSEGMGEPEQITQPIELSTEITKTEEPIASTKKLKLSNSFIDKSEGLGLAEQASNEIKSLGEANPLNNREVVLNGVRLELEPTGDGLRIKTIQSIEKGKGSGTDVLNTIKEIADKNGTSIIVYPEQIENTTKEQLVNWYKKNGFKELPSGEMKYETPIASTVKSGEVLKDVIDDKTKQVLLEERLKKIREIKDKAEGTREERTKRYNELVNELGDETAALRKLQSEINDRAKIEIDKLPEIPKTENEVINEKGEKDFEKIKKDLGFKPNDYKWGEGTPMDEDMGDMLLSKDKEAVIFIKPNEVEKYDEQNDTTDNITDGVKIELVSTKENSRGKGKAKELIQKVTDWADKNGTDLHLDIAPQDKNTTEIGLKKLYESFGFEFDGIHGKRKPKNKTTQDTKQAEVKQPIVEEVSETKRPTKEEKTPTTEGLNRAEAKKIHQRVKEMEVPTDAEQIALRYLAEGGKVSEAAINEVAGTVKRARLNTGEKELKSSEAKLRDYYEKNGQSLDELAHSLWEKSGQEVSERDIKDALMDAIGSYNNRLEASKAYLERYNTEYQEEQYYNRLAEERAEEHAQEELKIQEWLASKGEEELELAASEEHINNLIKQYETEFERENKQTEPTSESETNKEVSSRTSGEESKIEQEYKEIKTIKKKLKFVEDNFESIVSQLMLKNKIKRIC